MSVWRRAWISITRRKFSSFIVILTVFILANVLLTSLALTTALKNTRAVTLKQFPATVSVEYNGEYFDFRKNKKLSMEQAETLYRNTKELLKSYDYSLGMFLTKGEDIKSSKIFEDEIINDYNENSNLIMIEGTQQNATHMVEKGEATLQSGKGFTSADIKEGKPKAIVTKQFAKANNLDVGSKLQIKRELYEFIKQTISFGDAYYSQDLNLEIVGIIEINEIEEFLEKEVSSSMKDLNDKAKIQELADQIYVPNNFMYPLIKDNIQKALEKYPNEIGAVPGTSQDISVYPEFVLKDMKDLDVFLKEAEKVYNEKYYTLVSVAPDYNVIAKPMIEMQGLSSRIFEVGVIATIALFTLMLYIMIYLRKKEMCVLLALGERRRVIALQLFMETLILTIIGATLAIVTSILISNMFMNNAVHSILYPSRELSRDIASMYMSSSYGLTTDIVSKHVQSGFEGTTFVAFYITMILTVIISLFVSLLYVLRLHPKKTLM